VVVVVVAVVDDGRHRITSSLLKTESRERFGVLAVLKYML
jgi:hypothetical protein